MTLANLAWSQGRVRESAHHLLRVASNPPAEAGAVLATAMSLLRVGETAAARACLDHPAVAGTVSGQELMHHASLRQQLGQDRQALALLDRAHASGVDGAEFRFLRGVESLICGHLVEGEADLEMSLRMDPSAGMAALEVARLRTHSRAHNHLADFDRRVHTVRPGSQDHAALEFARYKELEDIGEYALAWGALERANDVMRRLFPCDRSLARRQADALIRLCTGGFLGELQDGGDEPQPIFIFGLPRSGTTLLDRLLGSHSQVASVGELEDFARQLCWAADQPGLLDAAVLERLPSLDYGEIGQRYLAQTQWRAPASRFFIDKQPWNHTVAGLIARALPRARLLHLVREPMDVCFSNYRAMLGARYAYSSDLESLALHYVQYRRLHAHWQTAMPGRVLDVSYTELVQHTEKTMRKVLAFCQLPWEPACMDSKRNSTAVGTLSAVQARAAIHTRAFGEWKPYERQLSGLMRDLSEAP